MFEKNFATMLARMPSRLSESASEAEQHVIRDWHYETRVAEQWALDNVLMTEANLSSRFTLRGDCQCRGTYRGGRCSEKAANHVHVHGPGNTIAQFGFCVRHIRQLKEELEKTVNHPDTTPHPAIVVAARDGDLAEVKRLLDSRNVDPCNVKHASDLLNACRTKIALERDRDGHTTLFRGDDDTPLIAAAREGHVDVVLELLARGADTSCSSCARNHSVSETASQAVLYQPGWNSNWVLEMLEIAAKCAAILKPGLASKGFMPPKPEKRTDWNSLSVDALKGYMLGFGLPVSGTKAEMVQALLSIAPIEDIYRDELNLWASQCRHLADQKAKRFVIIQKLKKAADKADFPPADGNLLVPAPSLLSPLRARPRYSNRVDMLGVSLLPRPMLSRKRPAPNNDADSPEASFEARAKRARLAYQLSVAKRKLGGMD